MLAIVVATGSRGDVEPYLALGCGLIVAGHTVRFITTSDFAGLATSHGLEVAEIPFNIRDRLADPGTRRDLQDRGPIRAFRALAELARAATKLADDTTITAAAGADVVVAGMGGHHPGLAAARRHRLPLVRAFNVPLTPTVAYPGALFAHWPAGPGGMLNRVSHLLSRRLVSLAAQRSLRAWADPFEMSANPGPIIYGISPSLLPRPTDWPAGISQTGFWFTEPVAGWQPPTGLQKWLADGPPPVYIGFGSMTTDSPAQTTALVIEAVQKAGVRAVVASGWAGLGDTTLPASMHLVGDVPHSWLFPQTSAVVHHGGAGTTAAGLRAGVPTIVVPFHGDQPFWGGLIHQRGLGPAPIPHRRLTAHALAEAIRSTAHPSTRTAASRIGARIRTEDGVGDTVRLIENTAR